MEESDKRIVRNTVYLYVRMALTMGISFFTTRIVLERLGVADYGINNVVAGFLSMLTIFNSMMQTGSRRFITLSLGRGDKGELKRCFSTAVVIHILTALVIIVLAESVGLWFINTRLNIEPGRERAMNVIYQCAIASASLVIIQNPLGAVVTAHEHFRIYSYISIAEAAMKLVTVYMLVVIPGDKLVIYGMMNLLVAGISLTVYWLYCRGRFEECHGRFIIDRMLLSDMIRFSGWSGIGNLSSVLNQHGVSILLNIFFGTAVNAARGLAGSVSFMITQMVNGMISASVPQLVKSYGAGDREKFGKLIRNVSQYAIFMLSVIAVPVWLEIDFVLKLWLTEVPEHTATFIRITILINIIFFSNIMIDQAIVAIGKMKQLALLTCPVYLLNFPLAYLSLRIGMGAASVYWCSLIPSMGGFLINLYILRRYTGFDSMRYFINIFAKSVMLTGVSGILPLIVQRSLEPGMGRFVTVAGVSVISTVSILYTFGINRETRAMIKEKAGAIAMKVTRWKTKSERG